MSISLRLKLFTKMEMVRNNNTELRGYYGSHIMPPITLKKCLICKANINEYENSHVLCGMNVQKTELNQNLMRFKTTYEINQSLERELKDCTKQALEELRNYVSKNYEDVIKKIEHKERFLFLIKIN